MSAPASADQQDVLEPFGGSAHPHAIVDTQIADYSANLLPVPYTLLAQTPAADSDINAVNSGEITDRTLTPLTKMGLTYKGIIENYIEDEESGNAGAILEWTP